MQRCKRRRGKWSLGWPMRWAVMFFKKRIGIPGRGKRGGARTLIAFR